MRAGHLKENVAALSGLGPQLEARIRRRHQVMIEQIEHAPRMAWLDVHFDAALMEAIAAETDLPTVRRLNSAAITKTIEGPLLRPLVQGALQLFGVTPSSLVRWTGHAYHQIYKECGEVLVNDDRSVVTVIGLPPFLRDSMPWLEGVAGALDGTVRVCRGTPSISYAPSSSDPTRVDFSLAY